MRFMRLHLPIILLLPHGDQLRANFTRSTRAIDGKVPLFVPARGPKPGFLFCTSGRVSHIPTNLDSRARALMFQGIPELFEVL